MARAPVGVRTHILLTVIGVVVVGFGLIYLIITPLIESTLRNERADRSSWLAGVVAAELSQASQTLPELEAGLGDWSRTLGSVCLGVTDAHGELFGASATGLQRCMGAGQLREFLQTPDQERWFAEGTLLALSVPLAVEGIEYGPGEGSRLVYIGKTAGIERRVRVARSLLFWSMLLAVGLVTLFGYAALTQLISRPLSRIGRAIERLQAGDSGARAESGGGLEIQHVADAFNALTHKLSEDESRIAHQIGELRLMNEKLEQAQDHLIRSEKLASVGTLAAGVAHEIGNPLSIAIGYLEFLQRPDVSDEERALFVEQAMEAVHRVDRIIRDLLDFSRPTGDDGAGDVNHAIEQSLQLLTPQKRFRHVTVETALPDGALVAGIAEQRLEQVLVNLLMNAADATAERGHAKVRIEASREPDPASGRQRIVLTVRDDGPGMTAATRGRIFDPFFTTKEPGSGTGLGLSICYNIITAIGGDISVESRPDAGTTFTVVLPGPAAE